MLLQLGTNAAGNTAVDLISDIVNDDDDSASHLGREVSLDQHVSDVERWVRTFSRNVGLPSSIADDLALAARWHDIGKADPRFQQMLHGGSPVRAAASTQLLAKSRADASDRAAREQARERASYPSGYRHEVLSVAMLESDKSALAHAHDPELVLHLVASHHGWCRPFAPAVDHGPSMLVELSLEHCQFTTMRPTGFRGPIRTSLIDTGFLRNVTAGGRWLGSKHSCVSPTIVQARRARIVRNSSEHKMGAS